MSKTTKEAQERAKEHATHEARLELARGALLRDPELCGKFSVTNVRESSDKDGTYNITLEQSYDDSVTFALLDAVSKRFDTKKIDVEPQTRQTGYCESCAGTEAYAEIYVYDAKL